jgi:hypothetical protein
MCLSPNDQQAFEPINRGVVFIQLQKIGLGIKKYYVDLMLSQIADLWSAPRSRVIDLDVLMSW